MNFKEILLSKGAKAGTLGSLVLKLFSTVLALLVSIFLARMLGLDGYGVYVLVFSIVALLTIPLTLGIPLLLNRYVPKYELEGKWSAVKGLLVRSHQFVFWSYGIIVILCILVYFFAKQSWSQSFIATAGWGLVLLPVLGLSAIRSSTLQGMRYVILGQFPDLVLRNFIWLSALVVYSMNNELSSAIAMKLHVLAALISYGVGFLLLKQRLGKRLKGISPTYYTKEWKTASFQFSLNMLVNTLKTRLATFLLAALSGTAAVAMFEVALKGANLVSFGLTAVNSAIAPQVSRLYEKDDFKALQDLVTKATGFIFLTSLPIALAFLIGGKYIISLFFGNEYVDSYVPLIVLVVAQLINAFAGSVGVLLIMTGFQKRVLYVNIWNVLFYCLMAVVFIGYFGVIGAACAYGILILIQNVIFVMYAKKYLKIKTTLL